MLLVRILTAWNTCTGPTPCEKCGLCGYGNFYKKKGKYKFVPVYAINAHRGSRNIAPLFLNSSTRRISVGNITSPTALATGNHLVHVIFIEIQGLRFHISITLKNLLTVLYTSVTNVCKLCKYACMYVCMCVCMYVCM